MRRKSHLPSPSTTTSLLLGGGIALLSVGALVRCTSIPDRWTATTTGPDGAPPPAVVPENCDPAADAKEPSAAGCVADSYAVFVNGAGGNDSAEGTRAAPLKTVKAAIAKAAATGRPRAYVCAGTYDEHAVLTTAVSLLGGFACGTWSYDGTKARLSPTTPGYALHLDRPAGKVVVSDMELSSPDAVEAGGSSIAVFANGADLLLRRASVSAGKGKDGAPGAPGAPGALVESERDAGLNGDSADPAGPGTAKICRCSVGSTQTIGGGGGGFTVGGSDGSPSWDAGGGNGSAAGACLPSREADGDPAPPSIAAKSGAALGTLLAVGWAPAAGIDGPEVGRPGQGGGGGGGGDEAGESGGGGGCGGCGGSPGKGGGGGGSSIGAAVIDSTLTLANSAVTTSDGAAGGPGGAGGVGAKGGGGGLQTVGGCAGGGGGRGADGSAGSGGAGGLSVGIMFLRGPSVPQLDESSLMQIAVGSAGPGGTGPATPPNNGPMGKAEKVLDATAL